MTAPAAPALRQRAPRSVGAWIRFRPEPLPAPAPSWRRRLLQAPGYIDSIELCPALAGEGAGGEQPSCRPSAVHVRNRHGVNLSGVIPNANRPLNAAARSAFDSGAILAAHARLPACPDGRWLRSAGHRAFAVLSRRERSRARAMRSPEARLRFAAGRAFLRRLLGTLCRRDPAGFVFQSTAEGKPWLAGGPCFSVSHSRDRLLVGVWRSGALGVDLERIRLVPRQDRIVARRFSPEESRAYLACPPADRQAAFFRIWARKEAVIKAAGAGSGLRLASFSVARPNPRDAAAPSCPRPIAWLPGTSCRGRPWRVREPSLPGLPADVWAASIAHARPQHDHSAHGAAPLVPLVALEQMAPFA